MEMNLIAAWTGVLAGLLVAVPVGLNFNKEDWLGGYSSWTRRLLRLGHIAFFGVAFLNFANVATAKWLAIPEASLQTTSILFVVARISMPLVCLAAAFKQNLRHLFVLPVLSLVDLTSAAHCLPKPHGTVMR
jgi:hypothetical protein